MTSLEMTAGAARAELRANGDEIEFLARDDDYDWRRPVAARVELALAGEGWFLGGMLPPDAASVEVWTTTGSLRVASRDRLWLAWVGRQDADGPLEVRLLGADRRPVDHETFEHLEALRPPLGVARADFAPERAPVRLHARRRRVVGWTTVCAAFVALSCLNLAEGRALPGWIGMGAFGPLLLAGGVQLLARWPLLVLDRDGLSWRTVGSRKRYAWSEVQAFRVVGKETVAFDFTGSSPHAPRRGSLPRALLGADAQLPEGFELEPPELAALLNAWRARYG